MIAVSVHRDNGGSQLTRSLVLCDETLCDVAFMVVKSFFIPATPLSLNERRTLRLHINQ